MIHIIGDSHVSVFSGTDYMQPTWPNIKDGPHDGIRANLLPGITQYRLGPITAYNFEAKADGWVQDLILSTEDKTEQLAALSKTKEAIELANSTVVDKENDWIFFNLGEIDCSAHLPKQSELTSIDRAVETCVRKYVTYLARIKSQGYNVGVIGPHIAQWHLENTVIKEITEKFNRMLKMSGFRFVTAYDFCAANPSSDNYIDGYHLSSNVLPNVLKQIEDGK